jgi:hypothetical protein
MIRRLDAAGNHLLICSRLPPQHRRIVACQPATHGDQPAHRLGIRGMVAQNSEILVLRFP